MESKCKTVLITGASSGIGYEFCKVFAENNYNLILVARRINRLNEVKKQLLEKYEIKINVIEVDLSNYNSSNEIYNGVKSLGVHVDVLINNAGIGNCGFFNEIPIENHRKVMEVNMKALTELTYFFSSEMKERGDGKILNVASTGSYQPGPLIAVYYASKAYVLSLTEALANELKNYNIQVSVLCPGTTSTEFHSKSGKRTLKNAMSPEKVAVVGYRGLMKGKMLIVPGFKNKLAIFMSKILPGYLSSKVVRIIQNKLI